MAAQFPEDMIGAIKIKDGLFIGDSFAAQVSATTIFTLIDYLIIMEFFMIVGLRVRSRQQSNAYNKLRREASVESLGG